MRSDVGDRWLQVRPRRRRPLPDQALAGAEAAVRGTAIGGQQQRAIFVAVDQKRHRFEVFFTERIAAIPRRRQKFRTARDHLSADRIVDVVGVDQGEKMRRDAEGQPAIGVQFGEAGEFVVAEYEPGGAQIIGGASSATQLIAPRFISRRRHRLRRRMRQIGDIVEDRERRHRHGLTAVVWLLNRLCTTHPPHGHDDDERGRSR